MAERFSPPLSDAHWGGRATRAEISLDAISHNVRALRAHSRSRYFMTVVKANAYGHGAAAVARTAVEHGATHLGVYAVNEGVGLRNSGITQPILVFGPFQPGEADAIVRHKLTPTLTQWSSAETLQRAAADRPIRVHLKADTGLNRAGLAPDAVAPFAARLRSLPALRLEGVYTHFARADERDKSSTREQYRLFLDICLDLERVHGSGLIRHASNSAATIDLPEMRLDMVRCGISTYGYYPADEVTRVVSLQPALQLLSAVSRVTPLATGTGVGYGHEFVAIRATLVALVPVGYGDGLPRSLGNGRGRVIIRGRLAPIVGRVSMDQITIDVTEIPETSIGDAVMLIGAEDNAIQDAEDVGRQAGTISYDILTGLLPRVPRLYASDGVLDLSRQS